MFKALFSRRSDANDVNDFSLWRLAASSATSWSWGVSVIFGMLFMQTKGAVPAAAWMAGNILALPALGFFRTYVPLSQRWLDLRAFYFLFLLMEYFAIILNLNGIKAALGGGIEFATYSFIEGNSLLTVIILLGLFLVWFIHKYGFRGSVLTDNWQYGIQLGGVIILAVCAFFLGSGVSVEAFKPGGADWALFGFAGVLAGPFLAGQQWERINAIPREIAFKVYSMAGLLFGIYMAFVFIAGLYFTKHILLGAILVVIVLAIATSTIDSAISAMQFIVRKFGLSYKVGSLLALVSILSWPIVSDLGVVRIWNTMAGWRLPTVISLVIGTVALQFWLRMRQAPRK